ncbi:MAG: CocE/NonD family hydrolase [Saprospiraceae bacterium]
MKSIRYIFALFSFCFLVGQTSFGQTDQKIATPFEFQFEEKTLRGLIEKPKDKKSTAIIILIPGYGKTNFVEGQWFSRLRDQLVATGLTVCFWDKMGCGNSDGVFNAQQPVENSAEEAIAAIRAIQTLNLPASNKIGLWGISRAGWICPLINAQFPIDFWISVSGTDDQENFGYLLAENLKIAGKQETEVEVLAQAWKEGHQLFCTQANFETYLKAIKPLSQDSTSRKLFGYKNETKITDAAREAYTLNQKTYTSKGHFDEESGLWVYLKDFDKILLEIKCPVLALFGANDSQVDWQKTKKLYEQTIGLDANSILTTKVFPQCNHSLQKCITCAYQEDLSASNWDACNGYYATMKAWLKDQGIIEASDK